MSTAADLAHLVGRDLGTLTAQIDAYPDDASLWRVEGAILNSAGTIAVHLVGNLSHYVGAVLGGTGYVRDRDHEFSERDVSKAEILARIAACRDETVAILEGLPEDVLAGPYPGELPPHLRGSSTRRFMIHLFGHLMWHLGQVNYHRRILVENAGA